MSDDGTINGRLISLLHPTAFVHYSPHLDLNRKDHFSIDISTRYYIRNGISGRSIIDYNLEEIRRQIELVINNKLKIPFKLPVKCSFKIQNETNALENFIRLPNAQDFNNQMRRILLDQNNNARDFNGVKLHFELHFWFAILIEQVGKFIFEEKQISLPKLGKEKAETTLDRLKNHIRNLLSEMGNSDFEFLELFLKNEIIDKHLDRSYHQGWEFLEGFEIGTNNSKGIKLLLDIIQKTSLLSNILTISWVGVSSGEEAFLRLFSRFSEIKESFSYEEFKKHINKSQVNNLLTKANTEDAVILIDEGEMGFHPQWQKDYVKYLLDILPQILPFKRIQIILTTHNPIVLSDIPKDSCIFLKKDKESNTSKVIEIESQTFGTNIATLLQDSFFLEGGFIGEFAKKKIEDLITRVKNVKPENPVKDGEILKTLRREIDLIGEPLIKNRLLDILEKKLGTNQTLEEEEIALEERLKEIKKLRNNDTN